jgi:hypothetical protein
MIACPFLGDAGYGREARLLRAQGQSSLTSDVCRLIYRSDARPCKVWSDTRLCNVRTDRRPVSPQNSRTDHVPATVVRRRRMRHWATPRQEWR